MPHTIKLSDVESKDLSLRYSSVTTIMNGELYLQRTAFPINSKNNPSQNNEEKSNLNKTIDLKMKPELVRLISHSEKFHII